MLVIDAAARQAARDCINQAGLLELSPSVVVQRVTSAVGRTPLTPATLPGVLAKLCPGAPAVERDMPALLTALGGGGRDAVPAELLCIAMLPWCGAGKARCMAAAWALAGSVEGSDSEAEHGKSVDGLTRRQLWALLRSLLAPLLLWGGAPPGVTADSVAVQLAAVAFKDVAGERLSFSSFATLYNAGEAEGVFAWLELLQPKKWVQLEAPTPQPPSLPPARPAPPALPQPAAPAPAPVPAHTPAPDDRYIFSATPGEEGFSFALGASRGASSHRRITTLSLPLSTAHLLVYTGAVSGLRSLGVEDVVDAVERVVGVDGLEGTLSHPQYLAVLDALIPPESPLPSGAPSRLAWVWALLWSGLHVAHSGGAGARELVAALSLFCGGGKSQKLEALFRRFGESKADAPPVLTLPTLASLLCGINLALSALQEAGCVINVLAAFNTPESDAGSSVCVESRAHRALAMCEEGESAAVSVVHAVGGEGGTVTLEAMSHWYNDSGHLVIPVLELLSVRVWGGLPTPAATFTSLLDSAAALSGSVLDAFVATQASESDDEAAQQSEGATGGAGAVVDETIRPPSSSVVLLQVLREGSARAQLDAVWEELQGVAAGATEVDELAFLRALRRRALPSPMNSHGAALLPYFALMFRCFSGAASEGGWDTMRLLVG